MEEVKVAWFKVAVPALEAVVPGVILGDPSLDEVGRQIHRHAFFDLTETVTKTEKVAAVSCAVHPEDVRVGTLGTIPHML